MPPSASPPTSRPSMPDASVRLQSLTGLRFFGALMVVLFHSIPLLQRVVPNTLTATWYVGVTFFFVLSGFVLTWAAQPGTGRGRFYWNRFSRIYPIYLLSVLAAIPVLHGDGEHVNAGILAVNVTLAQSWFPSPAYHFGMNPVAWSLSCEAFFYACFPFFAYRVLARRPGSPWRLGLRLVAAMAVVALVTHLVTGHVHPKAVLYVNPAYRIGEFMIGVALAAAIRGGWRPRFRLPGAVTLALGALAATVLVNAVWNHANGDQMPEDLAALIVVVPFTLLIAAAANADLTGASGNGPTPST